MCHDTADDGTHTTSDVHHALAMSWQMEHGRRVGYDVYRLVGHATSGGTPFLWLRYIGWMRDIDPTVLQKDMAVIDRIDTEESA